MVEPIAILRQSTRYFQWNKWETSTVKQRKAAQNNSI